MKQVYYTNKEFKEILSILEDLINEAEKLPYPKARELTTAILQHFDLVHREAIARMCSYMEANAPADYLKMKGDYTINTLLKLYDIIEDDQEKKEQSILGFIPEDNLDLITPIVKWEILGPVESVKAGTLYKETVRGNQVIYSRVNNKIFAMKNECLDSALPLDSGEFKDNYIICPWHGCRYDIATGKMVGNEKVTQSTFETRIKDSGDIEIKVPVNDAGMKNAK